MSTTITLEEIADGIDGGTVISIPSSEAEAVNKGDTLIEIETDKAVIPFPSPESGIIEKIFLKEGDDIKIGAKIAVISANSASTIEKKTEPESTTASTIEKKAEPESASTSASTVEKKAEPESASTSASTIEKKAEPESASTTASAVPENIAQNGLGRAAVSPQTRKLARELGVDVQRLQGSGRNSRISMADLKNYIRQSLQLGDGAASAISQAAPLPDFSAFGETSIEKASNIRMVIARRMEASWRTIPHVHHNFSVDISKLLHWKKLHGQAFKEAGSTLSPTPVLIKALAHCLLEFPNFNASLDMARQSIHYKKYCNIAVAVDTERGLLVPVILNADKLSVFQIGVELRAIALKAREQKLMPKDMQGACMTLSNLGGIAGEHFTPIINPPELAILGAAQTVMKTVQKNGHFEERPYLPLILGYDHRAIDGANAARFLKRFSEFIENPEVLLMGLQ